MSELLDGLDPNRPPIFVGAGVIRTEEQIRYYAEEPLLAAQIIGSFSEHENLPTDAYDKRVFYYDEASQAAYNAIRLRNPGRKAVNEYLSRAIRMVHDMGQVAMVGVTALAHEDPLEVIPGLTEWAFEQGADAVEINGSCPNQKYHILMCESVDMTTGTVTKSREKVGPNAYISVKMAALTLQAVQQYSKSGMPANCIGAINNCLRLSPINNITGLPLIEVNDGYAGQSGPIVKPLARKNTIMWRSATNYDVWSIGGVDNGHEIYDRHINLKADMVGGAQLFYRADDPRKEIHRLGREYEKSSQSAGEN